MEGSRYLQSEFNIVERQTIISPSVRKAESHDTMQTGDIFTLQPGDIIFNKYEFLQWLGGGTGGIVCLAKDRTLNKNVALKFIDTDQYNREERLKEARILDRLNHPAPHPHIVRFHSASIEPPHVVLDMEYIKGQPLNRLLEAQKSLPLERAVEITAHVLDALAFARTKHICHRDIKPANILIGVDGCVMLTDFGIADHLGTKSVMVGGGTSAYMAPEVFAPTPQMDYQSDVWSVGVVLYEMLSGQRPFKPSEGTPECTTQARWQEAITTQIPQPITTFVPDAPPALQIVLNRALSHHKNARFPSAQEFYNTLVRTRLYNPPLTKEEMELERHFRQVFASIEKRMDDVVKPAQGMGFKNVVREYANQNPEWPDKDELLRLAEVRNRFSHDLTPENERRLLPSPADVALLDQIRISLDSATSLTASINPVVVAAEPATPEVFTINKGVFPANSLQTMGSHSDTTQDVTLNEGLPEPQVNSGYNPGKGTDDTRKPSVAELDKQKNTNASSTLEANPPQTQTNNNGNLAGPVNGKKDLPSARPIDRAKNHTTSPKSKPSSVRTSSPHSDKGKNNYARGKYLILFYILAFVSISAPILYTIKEFRAKDYKTVHATDGTKRFYDDLGILAKAQTHHTFNEVVEVANRIRERKDYQSQTDDTIYWRWESEDMTCLFDLAIAYSGEGMYKEALYNWQQYFEAANAFEAAKARTRTIPDLEYQTYRSSEKMIGVDILKYLEILKSNNSNPYAHQRLAECYSWYEHQGQVNPAWWVEYVAGLEWSRAAKIQPAKFDLHIFAANAFEYDYGDTKAIKEAIIALNLHPCTSAAYICLGLKLRYYPDFGDIWADFSNYGNSFISAYKYGKLTCRYGMNIDSKISRLLMLLDNLNDLKQQIDSLKSYSRKEKLDHKYHNLRTTSKQLAEELSVELTKRPVK